MTDLTATCGGYQVTDTELLGLLLLLILSDLNILKAVTALSCLNSSLGSNVV